MLCLQDQEEEEEDEDMSDAEEEMKPLPAGEHFKLQPSFLFVEHLNSYISDSLFKS